MTAPEDTNAEIWMSESQVRHWVAGGGAREERRLPQWQLMGALLPFAADEPFTFADLGAGTGAASRALLDLYPKSSALLCEFSPQMAAEGHKAMAPFADRYRYVEMDLNSGEWPEEVPDSLPAVVTSLCVHHLPDERKGALFAEIHDHLAPGGWYLNYDPVRTDDAAVTAAWTRANDRSDPEAAEKAKHRTPSEQARYENHVRYISPLAPQLTALRAAGFEAVDVYWRQCDMVIFGGRRAG